MTDAITIPAERWAKFQAEMRRVRRENSRLRHRNKWLEEQLFCVGADEPHMARQRQQDEVVRAFFSGCGND